MSIMRGDVVVVLVHSFFFLDLATTAIILDFVTVFQATQEKAFFSPASFIGPVNLQ